MATAKDREEFIARVVRSYPRKPVHHVLDFARELMRLARQHGNLAVQQCNGPQWCGRFGYTPKPGEWEEWDTARQKREDACEKRICKLCAAFAPKLKVRLGGDPRGFTVKLKLPSGTHNTWGGSEEGYGVPQ